MIPPVGVFVLQGRSAGKVRNKLHRHFLWKTQKQLDTSIQ